MPPRNRVSAGDVINVYRDGVLIAANVYIVGAWLDGIAYRPLEAQQAGSEDVGIWRYHEFNDDAVTIEKV